VKLGWALGMHPDEPDKVRELMQTPISNDMTPREPHDGYLVFQGGVPEIQDFLKKIWS
jgi:glutamyl-tRNA(Gln) amidotransferase subunit D